MGQCFVASHTVGSPDKGQCKLKKCAESSHCFVRKPSHNSLCGRIRKREERKAFGCGAILMKEFCANKKTSAPSPSPFPLFSPWAGQLLSSLPMGEKRGKGEGDGAVLWLPTQWAAQTAVSESKNLCSIQALFCQKSLFVRKPSHNIWLVVCGCVCKGVCLSLSLSVSL